MILAIALIVCSLVLGPGAASAHENPPARIAACTARLAATPDDAKLYLERGQLYRLETDWPAASADYRAALALGADSTRVAMGLAALELDRDRPAAALAALRAVSGRASGAGFLEGRALHRLGRHAEAATVLTQALATTPRPRPENYLELAVVVGAQGNTHLPRALAVLDAGMRRLGPLVTLILAATDLELRRGQPEAALARLRTAPACLRESPGWLTRRGEILLQTGATWEAQALFTDALSRLEALPATRRNAPDNLDLSARLRAYLNAPLSPATGETP